jgi:hypothetical protein
MRRLVQIRDRRKQRVLGSKPPLGLESPVAVAEQHRYVIGEPVRRYNIRDTIVVNNARLMPAPGIGDLFLFFGDFLLLGDASHFGAINEMVRRFP